MNLLPNCDVIGTDRDPDWLEKRQEGLGASEAATILGINAYQSPHRLWLEKVGLEEPEPAGESARMGKLLEPIILKLYQDETARVVQSAGVLVRNREYPWLQATLDATAFLDPDTLGIVEAKLTRREADWKDGVPDYVYAQVQHQMLTTGLRMASTAALLSGIAFVWTDVPFDEPYALDYLERAKAFWEAVVSRTPPKLEPTDACGRALAKFYGREAPGTAVNLPGEMIGLDERREEIGTETKGELAALLREKAGIDNEIKNAIGDAMYGMLPNGITFKWGTTDVKASTCPHCAGELKAASSYRKLTRSTKTPRD